MNIKGKKIVFLGDSITEGEGVSDPKEKTYWAVLGKLSGAIVKGYGIGGTRIAEQLVKTDAQEDTRDFITRVDKMDADADIVVIFGGTNDYGHGDAPLGKMSDRTNVTFYGAMHNLCQAVIEQYPHSIIVIITPMHRLNEEQLINERGVRNVATLAEYVNAERQVAEYYSLPLLDLYATGFLNPAVPKIQELYMPDGLHPNDDGSELIAKRLLGFLNSLMV